MLAQRWAPTIGRTRLLGAEAYVVPRRLSLVPGKEEPRSARMRIGALLKVATPCSGLAAVPALAIGFPEESFAPFASKAIGRAQETPDGFGMQYISGLNHYM